MNEYNTATEQFSASPHNDVNKFIPSFVSTWPDAAISWNDTLRQQLQRGTEIKFKEEKIRRSIYRPFTKQQVYFDRQTSDRVYQLPTIFPTPKHDNIGIGICAASTRTPFAVLGLNTLPNLGLFMDPVQFFPRWTWKKLAEGEFDLGVGNAEPGEAGEVLLGYRRVDNITDEILGIYQHTRGMDVTKDQIFYFVYAQLHDPAYRAAYTVDLEKMLPHIETPTDRVRFDRFVAAGRELMTLHIGYESVELWPVNVVVKDGLDLGEEDRETWRVTKLKWGKVRDPETKKLVDDRTRIVYNSRVTIEGIPLEADEYMLGSRSALAWIIDRYKVSTDAASGIVSDPNDWADEVGNPHYIVDLIAKVTRVAVETVRIVNSLDD